ncbi:MAG TPA: hypothetical protein VHK69_15030 [Chitinophagaceae bacterium]|jgi:hypothetical protein|nr:hypothetical protein [Chitinophagaceae bacterium]
MEATLTPTDPARYVSGLEIAEPEALFPVVRTRGLTETTVDALVAEGTEQAFISDKSLVSFVAEVGGQNRKDVINSTLLAQLAANKKFSLENDMKGWYDAFIDVLSKLGWVMEEAEINTFNAREDLVEVESVIIDILTAAFGAKYIDIIKNTLNSLKKLSDSDDKRFKVFEKNTQTVTKGCFQIALAVEQDGVVSMQLGTFLLTSSTTMKKILFVRIHKATTRLDYSSRTGTFNTDIYATARQAVTEKLSKDIQSFVAELEI